MTRPIHVVDPRFGPLVGLKMLGGPASMFSSEESQPRSRFDFECSVVGIDAGPFGAKVIFRLSAGNQEDLQTMFVGMQVGRALPIFGKQYLYDGTIHSIVIGHRADAYFHWLPYQGIHVPSHWLDRGIPASLALHRIFGPDETRWPAHEAAA